ncbi:MAG: glycoside hydrolase family 76 protein [Luteolibacter sp.]
MGILIPVLLSSAKAQMTDGEIKQMTQTCFANFKANKWNNFGDYWGWKTKDGEGYRYYWEQALCIMASEDEAEYGTSPDAKEMVSKNLDGFIKKYGEGLGMGWNDFIDDLGWAQCAFARGYRITGDKKYLNAAIRFFNVGFERGTLGPTKRWEDKFRDGREGLWWRVNHSRYKDYDEEGKNGKANEDKEVKNQDFYKSPLSTSPHIVTGAMLYDFTGKQEYLDKAVKMWEWEINTLWEVSDDSGIHEGQNIPREAINGWDAVKPGLRSRRTMHDLSTFFEGTNALYHCTGDRRYLAWCWKIVNSVLTHRLDKNNAIQNAFSARDGAWCWEAGRAWSMFCADSNLWDYKGTIPVIEGNYTDYTGKQKPYTTRVKGALAKIPNDWTLYQFMANSAKEIKDSNGTTIILPTNRARKSVWKTTMTVSKPAILEAENPAQVNGPNLGKGTGKNNLRGEEILVEKISVAAAPSASNGKKVANVGWGNTLQFTYNARSASTSRFEVAYATSENRYLTISINGEAPLKLTCGSTGGDNVFKTQSIEIPLKSGINKFIVGGPDNGWAPDLDYFSFSLMESTFSSPQR